MALFYYYDQNPFCSKMARVSFYANAEAVFKPASPADTICFNSLPSSIKDQILYSQVSRGCAIHVFLVYIFLNFVIPARSKALICTRKQNGLQDLVVK